MIIVKLEGGLGNQLFQYVFAKQLSVNNNVPLKLGVSSYRTNLLRKYKLHHYNITSSIATDQEVKKLFEPYGSPSFCNRLRRKWQYMLPKYRRSYFKEDDYYKFEPDWNKITSDILLDGFWQHYKYFERVSPEIMAEITLKEEYKVHATGIISEIERNDFSASLHVRRGDYANDRENLDFFGLLPVEYYARATEYLNSRIPNLTYYIFSDDLEWAKCNLDIKARTVFVDMEEGKRDYIELHAMSKCRHNIIANSSFSWWGAFLNNNPHKIVIAPQKWVVRKDLQDNVEIQFPSWIKF